MVNPTGATAFDNLIGDGLMDAQDSAESARVWCVFYGARLTEHLLLSPAAPGKIV